MGQSPSALVVQVFKPPSPPSYDESLPGLFWIETILPNDLSTIRRIPAVIHRWKDRETGEWFTMIFSGGNTTDMGQHLAWAKLVSETLHANVLCYDYSGYGLNRGAPSEKSAYDDITAVYKYLLRFLTVRASWLRDVEQVPASSIVLYGCSLGTGPTIELAANLSPKRAKFSERMSMTLKTRSLSISARHPISTAKSMLSKLGKDVESGFGGIILQSPMLSVMKIAKQGSVIGVADMFENHKKVDKLRVPVLIVHGANDDVIPAGHSRKLAGRVAFLYRLQEITDAGHHDLFTDSSDDVLDAMLDYVNHINPRWITTKVREVPSGIKNSPLQIITEWLRQLGLEKYVQAFLAAGFFSLDMIATLEEPDLDLVGVDGEDRALLLGAVRLLRPATPVIEGSPRRSFRSSRTMTLAEERGSLSGDESPLASPDVEPRMHELFAKRERRKKRALSLDAAKVYGLGDGSGGDYRRSAHVNQSSPDHGEENEGPAGDTFVLASLRLAQSAARLEAVLASLVLQTPPATATPTRYTEIEGIPTAAEVNARIRDLLVPEGQIPAPTIANLVYDVLYQL